MIRLGRRTTLLLVLSLVASAATAYAECAWVLWQQQGEISPSGSVSSSDWTWLTAEATSTEAEPSQAREPWQPSPNRRTKDDILLGRWIMTLRRREK
jgi:hypothetical protein